MFSTSTPRCITPRPLTSKASAASVGATSSATSRSAAQLEARGDLAARDELALLAGEGRVVDAEHHRDRRLLERDRRAAARASPAGRACRRSRGPRCRRRRRCRRRAPPRPASRRRPSKRKSCLIATGGRRRALGVADDHALADARSCRAARARSPMRPMKSSWSSVAAWNCSGAVLSRRGVGTGLEDHVEERRQVAPAVGRTSSRDGAAVAPRAVDHREVELLVVRAELDEEVEDLVQDLARRAGRGGRSC